MSGAISGNDEKGAKGYQYPSQHMKSHKQGWQQRQVHINSHNQGKAM